MEIDIQVDAAGRPSNLAAGGWGHANGEASVKFTMPGAQKILINHCNLFVLCSGPIAFKIKVMEAEAKNTPAREEERSSFKYITQSGWPCCIEDLWARGDKTPPSALEADEEAASVTINTLPTFATNWAKDNLGELGFDVTMSYSLCTRDLFSCPRWLCFAQEDSQSSQMLSDMQINHEGGLQLVVSISISCRHLRSALAFFSPHTHNHQLNSLCHDNLQNSKGGGIFGIPAYSSECFQGSYMRFFFILPIISNKKTSIMNACVNKSMLLLNHQADCPRHGKNFLPLC